MSQLSLSPDEIFRSAPRWSDPNLWALEAVTALFCRFPSTGFELAYQEIVGRKNQPS
jgi:hypothetical protein